MLRDIVEAETAPRAVQVRVLGAFVALALLVAAIGIHGVRIALGGLCIV